MDAPLYLSRLRFAPTPRGMALRQDPYRVHALMRSMGGEGRYLYRLEHSRMGWSILLQTWVHPDLTFLDPQELQLEGVKRLPFTVLQPRRAYRFMLLTNPTRRRQADRQRITLSAAEVPFWLQRQLQGAILKGVRVEERLTVQIDKSDDIIRYQAYRIRGSLYCSDPGALWQTLRQGVGRGKAFGLGLLSLAPVR